MILPSKELLSEVFGFKVISVHNVNAENDIHFNGGHKEKYPYSLIEPTTINIYELAHKCKEWALSKNYEIESSLFVDGNKKRIGYSQVLRKESPMLQKTADTEPEAIFKACEYIMEQTKCGS